MYEGWWQGWRRPIWEEITHGLGTKIWSFLETFLRSGEASSQHFKKSYGRKKILAQKSILKGTVLKPLYLSSEVWQIINVCEYPAKFCNLAAIFCLWLEPRKKNQMHRMVLNTMMWVAEGGGLWHQIRWEPLPQSTDKGLSQNSWTGGLNTDAKIWYIFLWVSVNEVMFLMIYYYQHTLQKLFSYFLKFQTKESFRELSCEDDSTMSSWSLVSK